MRETYANAKIVLVLDAFLQEVGKGIYERRLQVICSEWMRRLWTLQEALLSKPENLLIQFRHHAVSLARLVDENIQEGLSEIRHNFEVQTVQLLSKYFPTSAPDEHNLLVLVRGLQRRSTTKAEDELICRATLTDVSLEQFRSQPSMAQILKILTTVPQGLIFIPGPRMTPRVFRWAPRSLLNQVSSRIGQPQAALEADAMPSTLTDRGTQIFKPPMTFQHGFTVSEKFIKFTKSAIWTSSCAVYGIGPAYNWKIHAVNFFQGI